MHPAKLALIISSGLLVVTLFFAVGAYAELSCKQKAQNRVYITHQTQQLQLSSPLDDTPVDALLFWVDPSDVDAYNNYWSKVAEDDDGTTTIQAKQRMPATLPPSVKYEEAFYATCLASKHMPWLRQILIVASHRQSPKWLPEAQTRCSVPVRVVDDTEFVPRRILPVFSSFPLTAHMDLIPGVAERLLVLDDDTFVQKPVSRSQLFDSSTGLPVNTTPQLTPVSFLGLDTQWGKVVYNSVKGATTLYRPLAHTVRPFTRTQVRTMRDRFPDKLETMTHRIRTQDSACPMQLMVNMMDFYEKRGNMPSNKSFNAESRKGLAEAKQQLAQQAVQVLNINNISNNMSEEELVDIYTAIHNAYMPIIRNE